MRQAFLVMAGAALTLGLAGCGSEKSGEFTTPEGGKGEYTIDEKSGETRMTITSKEGKATLRSGADVPLSLPEGFSLFPGSKVVTNTVVDQPDGKGTLVSFEAAAPAEKVIAHYRDEAKAAGFAIELELTTNGTTMLGAQRKEDGTTLSVTASNGETTTGQIIFGTKKAG
ncbi:hypothetical protein [Erythrobacter cryptus]|uniref:hypothetical protein n=1 Tax=Erythrobacter cryptus TaxID=196588 RepID=UPI00041B908D|nr:hypothetical protein [Erythrobacter cryptus]